MNGLEATCCEKSRSKKQVLRDRLKHSLKAILHLLLLRADRVIQ